MFPLEPSIHNRPEHIKSRETFGEWEGDLMIFRREHGKANGASLVERKTRYAVLFRNNDRSSKHFIAKLMNAMEPLPQTARKSITFDRGLEFSGWRKLNLGSEPRLGFVIRKPPSRDIATRYPAGQCMAKRFSRKPEQTSPKVSATRYPDRGTLKARYEGD